MDKIIINGLEIFARHGVNPEEKILGQKFILDITAYTDLKKAGQTDDLNDTVSYAKILKTARNVFTAKDYDLLERAAHAVAQELFAAFPAINALDITVKKPAAPINAVFSWVGVEIHRERE